MRGHATPYTTTVWPGDFVEANLPAAVFIADSTLLGNPGLVRMTTIPYKTTRPMRGRNRRLRWRSTTHRAYRSKLRPLE